MNSYLPCIIESLLPRHLSLIQVSLCPQYILDHRNSPDLLSWPAWTVKVQSFKNANTTHNALFVTRVIARVGCYACYRTRIPAIRMFSKTLSAIHMFPKTILPPFTCFFRRNFPAIWLESHVGVNGLFHLFNVTRTTSLTFRHQEPEIQNVTIDHH